jgi:phospholipid/cholesterol/gamma-HCH transport system ATP-binding protein
MIELRNVHFAYGEQPVLRDVSFVVDDAEAVVIMGPSGSGKSTILRLILGLDCPRQGEVLVDHKDVCRLKSGPLREVRKKIGMVFQEGALFDSMTVGENVGYYLIEHTKLAWEEIEQRARTMLGFVGLDADEVIDKLPNQLSGGMRRRVAIGRALLSTDPKIMLYDEPTTGLDPYATRNVINLINKLHRERPISSIVVTHQIADAFAVADRFIVIYQGEVALDGSLEDLRESTDQRVVDFLAPFRSSMEGVFRRKFVDGNAGK